MKWIVQLDYEFGEFEPNSIYFRRVCSDDMEYGSAYDTKREALEAFCQGQYAINQLRKEREAEQKKEEPQRKLAETISLLNSIVYRMRTSYRGINLSDYPNAQEAFEYANNMLLRIESGEIGKVSDEQKEAVPKGEQKYGDNFLPPEGYTNGKEQKIMERLEALEEAIHKPYIPFSVREAKDIVYKYQAKVKALENRLTEIEGVLTSIGSPDYDLRKKVEKLEKGLEGLNTTFRLYSKNEIERSAVLEKNIDKLSEKVFGSIEGKNT